jgi:uncharacterized sulfatase
VTTAFVQGAIAFIDQARSAGQPFFVNLWPDDVHSPFFPPKELRTATDGSKRAMYCAVLDALDQQLRPLFDRIRNDPALRDNTLILVMSDNGHEEGAGSSDPLRGGKTWLYEGGVRSPLVAWGPGLQPQGIAGTTNRQSVFCALDLNRSLYTLTGVPVAAGSQLDGEDLSTTLLGRQQGSRTAPIFWRRPPDRPGTDTQDNPDLAVRDGKWKYYVNWDGSGEELYDLESDVSETKNVVAERRAVADQLQAKLLAWNNELPVDAVDPHWRPPDHSHSDGGG